MKQMDAIGAAGSIGDFEKVFEDLDVKTADLTGAIESATADSAD